MQQLSDTNTKASDSACEIFRYSCSYTRLLLKVTKPQEHQHLCLLHQVIKSTKQDLRTQEHLNTAVRESLEINSYSKPMWNDPIWSQLSGNNST